METPNTSKTAYESLDLPGRVKQRLGAAVTQTKRKFQLFTEFDKIYNQSGLDQIGNAQVHNPYSWAAIESITPRMVSKKPTVTYSPVSQVQGDDEDNQSKMMQGLFDHWYTKDKAFSKLVSWVKGSEIYGTDHVKIYWKTEKQIMRTYEYDEEGLPRVDEKTGKLATKEEEITTFDDPTMENVSVYHLFVDPNATSLYNARWIIHRYYKTIEELEDTLENGKPVYQNLDQLRLHINASSVDSDSPEDSLRHEYAFLRRNRSDKTINLVTCLEMWDMESETMSVVAEGQVEIRPEQPFPFWHGRAPFVKLVDSIVPQEYYGKGEIEPVLKQQYALDTMDSMDLDNRIQSLQPMWKVSGDVDESELQFRQNGIIHFNANLGESVDPIVPPDLTRTSVQAKEQLKSDMQQALGISDYTAGADSTADRTATGTNIKAQSANSRFAHKLQFIEEAIEEVGFQVMALYQQFMTDAKNIEVNGQLGAIQKVRLTPAQIAGEFTVKVEAGSSAPVDKDSQRQDALTLFQLLQPIQDPNVQYHLTRELVQTFNFPDLLQAVDKTFQSQIQAGQQGGGQPDPHAQAMQQAAQQHAQSIQQSDQQHQMTMQLKAQQSQAQIQASQQTALIQAKIKQAEIQSRLDIEKMKIMNEANHKSQPPHISEIIPFDKMPAVAQDALLHSIGLPTGAQQQQAQASIKTPQNNPTI